MVLKSVLDWLRAEHQGSGYTGGTAPLLFERLESRLLLSADPAGAGPSSPVPSPSGEHAVIEQLQAGAYTGSCSFSGSASFSSGVFDNVTISDPGSTVVEDDAPEERWVPYVPTAEQTSVSIVNDREGIKATVTLVFPDCGYHVRSWGTLFQEAGRFSVDAEVEKWTGPSAEVVTSISHEYDLGTLIGSSGVFTFNAWQSRIRTEWFRPESVPYTPTVGQTSISVVAAGSGTTIRVTLTLPDNGYSVSDWGTIQRQGGTLLVNGHVYRQSGAALQETVSISQDYDLGSVLNGAYTFMFLTWDHVIQSQDLVVSDALQPVYRFWSPVLGRHFYTISAAERDKLINSYANVWTYEGVGYNAFANGYRAGVAPVYRFWSETLKSHFFTTDESEKTKTMMDYPDIWVYEGVAFYAYRQGYRPEGTVGVHRFWSGTSHFFTTSLAERDKLLSLLPGIWTYEATAWYVYDT